MRVDSISESDIKNINDWFAKCFTRDDASSPEDANQPNPSIYPPDDVVVAARSNLKYILCLNDRQRRNHLTSLGYTDLQAVSLSNLQHSWPAYEARVRVTQIAQECAANNYDLATLLDQWLCHDHTRGLLERLAIIKIDQRHLGIVYPTCRAAEIAIKAYRGAIAERHNVKTPTRPPAPSAKMLPQILHEPDQSIKDQLNELSKIDDGWDGPDSKGPRSEDVDWLRDALELHWRSDMPAPFIFPMESGGLNIEWYVGHTHHGLEIDFTDRTGLWEWWDSQSDQEHEETLNLTTADHWRKLQISSRGWRTAV